MNPKRKTQTQLCHSTPLWEYSEDIVVYGWDNASRDNEPDNGKRYKFQTLVPQFIT